MVSDSTKPESRSEAALAAYEKLGATFTQHDPREQYTYMTSKLRSDYTLMERIGVDGKSVLNIGSSFPIDEIYYARKIGSWVGIDLSPQSIEGAQMILERELHPDLAKKFTFQVADACDLPFDDNTFDVSLNMSTIDHIPSPEARQKAVDEMARTTKRGGYVILTGPNWWCLPYALGIRKMLREKTLHYGYTTMFSPLQFRKMGGWPACVRSPSPPASHRPRCGSPATRSSSAGRRGLPSPRSTAWRTSDGGSALPFRSRWSQPSDPPVSIEKVDVADPPGQRRRHWSSLLSVSGLTRLGRSRIVRALFLATVLVLLAVALAERGPALWHQMGRLSLPVVIVAFITGLGGLMCSLMVWRSLLADLGSPLSVNDAFRVMFIGQLAKYLPGSVWPLLAQAELAADRGVPRTRTGVSVLLSSAVMVWTGGLVAAVTLPFASTASTGQYLWIMLAAPVTLILLSPPVLNRSLRLLLRLLRRSSLYQPATLRGLAVSTGWATLGWSLNGLMIYVLTTRLGGHDGRQILAVSVAGYALSWVAGFLFIIAPAGAGVREAILVAVVNVQTTGTVAITVALVARGLAVVADAVAGAVAAALVGHRRLQALRSASQATSTKDE